MNCDIKYILYHIRLKILKYIPKDEFLLVTLIIYSDPFDVVLGEHNRTNVNHDVEIRSKAEKWIKVIRSVFSFLKNQLSYFNVWRKMNREADIFNYSISDSST